MAVAATATNVAVGSWVRIKDNHTNTLQNAEGFVAEERPDDAWLVALVEDQNDNRFSPPLQLVLSYKVLELMP